jgi:hypothetical protein
MVLRLPVVVFLSLFTVALAGPTKYGVRKCWNHPTTEEMGAKEGKFSDVLSKIESPTRIASNFSNHTIPVYFNVISSGTELSQGCIPYVVLF